MKISGRIIGIKKTKNNIFINVKNEKKFQLVIKEELFNLCKELTIGDIISCNVIEDTKNNGKYKCEYETYRLVDLKIISKNVNNYYIKYNYDDLKEYSDAKYRIRDFLRQKEYIEVNVPILTDGETSSKAHSFETYYSKTNKKLFLRKTMDSFLRMLSCSDLNKIYSIGPCFRNEYVTSKNVSEFEMLSIFTNYLSQDGAIELSLNILQIILKDEKLQFKYITEKDYNKNYESNVFYIVNSFENNSNSYSNINDDGTTNEFKIKYNDVTIVHGVMEIKNIKEYLNKISIQGKKEFYGELNILENCIGSGAPLCYNLGISIVRTMAIFYGKKISNYDIFSFSRLNLKNGEKNE